MGVTFQKSGIYRPRWQYWYPWGVTRWWLPRVFRGGSEWCDDSACVILPPLGGFAVFWRPGPMRAMPCPEDWAGLDDAARADYAPCGWLHGGSRGMRMERHHHVDDWPCEEAQEWLKTATAA